MEMTPKQIIMKLLDECLYDSEGATILQLAYKANLISKETTVELGDIYSRDFVLDS